MPASTYAGNKILDLILRGVAFTPPTRVYVSLHTADPGNAGANEITLAAWPAYVRRDPAQGSAIASGFSAAAGKATSNAKDILWDDAMDGAASITVTHWAVWDAATGGNCLNSGTLTANKILAPTDECVIHPGEMNVSVV